jgi:hypothetical protein
MLVLAVGIMLALILNWNVDLAVVSAATDNTPKVDESVTFTEDDLEQSTTDEIPSGDELTKLGTVYYDAETGKYYIITSEG